jgi:hypothetical protein
MDNTEKVLITILIAVTAVLAGTIGFEIGRQGARKEALLLGHAHYETDNDGHPQFTWTK